MNRTALVIIMAALLTSPFVVLADQAPSRVSDPPKRVDLPPPSIHDQGVGKAAVAPPETDSVNPAMPDTRPVRDKASRDKERSVDEIRASSEVTRRTEGADTIEEYREKGRLRMIRVIPQNGPEQIYMDSNGDGRLDRDSRDGPVSPVYFKLYEWN